VFEGSTIRLGTSEAQEPQGHCWTRNSPASAVENNGDSERASCQPSSGRSEAPKTPPEKSWGIGGQRGPVNWRTASKTVRILGTRPRRWGVCAWTLDLDLGRSTQAWSEVLRGQRTPKLLPRFRAI